jgi:cysteinyl-tRNA synthetase
VAALQPFREQAPSDAKARGVFIRGAEELVSLARVLGLLEGTIDAAGPPPEVDDLVAQRQAARTGRDWPRADQLRQEILVRGWLVEDTPAGPRLTRRAS